MWNQRLERQRELLDNPPKVGDILYTLYNGVFYNTTEGHNSYPIFWIITIADRKKSQIRNGLEFVRYEILKFHTSTNNETEFHVPLSVYDYKTYSRRQAKAFEIVKVKADCYLVPMKDGWHNDKKESDSNLPGPAIGYTFDGTYVL